MKQRKEIVCLFFLSMFEGASNRVYRPWLKYKLFRIITGDEQNIQKFREFSNMAIIRVSILQFKFTKLSKII